MKKKIVIIIAFLLVFAAVFGFFVYPKLSERQKIINVAEAYLQETGDDFSYPTGAVTLLGDNKAEVYFSEPVPKGADLKPSIKIVTVDLSTMKAYEIVKK